MPVSRIRRALVNLDSRIQSIVIGIVVGLASGLAAAFLKFSLGKADTLTSTLRPAWMVAGLPILGLLATVFWLKRVIRDHGGHGVPEVIYAVGMKGGRIGPRSILSKLVGALLTLGSGGSAGPEAPVVISGAAIGSNIARAFRTNDRIRIAVAGSGAAAAIASIFNAPIAGIIFTMEVILGEWSSQNLLPVAIASATGTVVSRSLNGNHILFRNQGFDIGPAEILAAAGLAVFAAICSAGLIRSVRAAAAFLSRLLRNDFVRAAAGGLLVGAAAWLFAEVRGEGYGVVEDLIEGRFAASAGIILLLIVFKVIATAVTIGAGGAGGVFAPCLVVGSLCGLLFFRVLTAVVPGGGFENPGLFSLVGMAGVLSGTLQAPLTGIFLILEITSGYDAILPLVVVAFISSVLVRLTEKHSIYHRELADKGQLVRPRTDARILADLKVDELLETDCIAVHPEMTLQELVGVVKKSERNYFPVEDRETGRFLGLLHFSDIKSYLFTPELPPTIIVEEVMRADPSAVSRRDSLNGILNMFEKSRSWSLPVVEEGRFIGLISKATLLDHYRKELMAQTDL